MLYFLEAKDGDGRDVEAVLGASLAGLAVAGRVRSTLFRVDETRPCPPFAREKVEEGLKPGEKKYLCFVRATCCEVIAGNSC